MKNRSLSGLLYLLISAMSFDINIHTNGMGIGIGTNNIRQKILEMRVDRKTQGQGIKSNARQAQLDQNVLKKKEQVKDVSSGLSKRKDQHISPAILKRNVQQDNKLSQSSDSSLKTRTNAALLKQQEQKKNEIVSDLVYKADKEKKLTEKMKEVFHDRSDKDVESLLKKMMGNLVQINEFDCELKEEKQMLHDLKLRDVNNKHVNTDFDNLRKKNLKLNQDLDLVRQEMLQLSENENNQYIKNLGKQNVEYIDHNRDFIDCKIAYIALNHEREFLEKRLIHLKKKNSVLKSQLDILNSRSPHIDDAF